MQRSAARLLASVFLLAFATIGVRSQGSGVIEGQVLNGTSGNVPVEGLSVALWALDAQQQNILQQGKTDAEGRFRFQDLDAQARSYQVQTEYQGVSYQSDTLTLSQDQSLLSVPMTIYDSTASDADLGVERAHLILDFQPGTILVQELQILSNGGNKTYVGSGPAGEATARFVLPPGAAKLQLPEELVACCVVQTSDGFAYTRPVLPGTLEFFFSYELPHQSSSFTLTKGSVYPMRYLDVLVADKGVKVTGPGLTAQEPVSLQDSKYQHLSAENLSATDPLALHFANLPQKTQPSGPRGTASPMLVRAVIALGTLAVIAVLGYPFFKKRQGQES